MLAGRLSGMIARIAGILENICSNVNAETAVAMEEIYSFDTSFYTR
jgi:hypothetical protein